LTSFCKEKRSKGRETYKWKGRGRLRQARGAIWREFVRNNDAKSPLESKLREKESEVVSLNTVLR
jgi:hypothetical protein